ncbi:MAG: hypothetical protein IPG09_15445 [Ignavibacteria bacterium]|nr:hypothetical protein [Ignavibacteria bacterium]MBK7446253.1 hypothetical protein [Ignavibacteria bacterium]
MKKIKLSIFASVIILFLLFKQDLFCQDSVLNTSDRSWAHFAFLSGGAGMHFNKERDVEKDKLLLFWEILSIKGGFKSLAGFGIGTKVYEEYYMDSIKVNSFIPVYAYFPLYMSKPRKKEYSRHNAPKRKSLLYLYAGTSFLSSSNVKNYQNIGVGYSFTYDLSNNKLSDKDEEESRLRYLYSSGSLTLNIGYLFYQKADSNKDKLIYFRITWDFGLGVMYP